MAFLSSPLVYHTHFGVRPSAALAADPSPAQRVADAHRAEGAYGIEAYVSWLGPQPTLHFFTALSSRGEMDSLPRQQEFADRSALRSLGDSFTSHNNSLLERSEAHSTTSGEDQPKLIYHSAFRISPAYSLPAEGASLDRYVEAHRKGSNGHSFVTFFSWLGPQPTLHLFTPLSSYGQMDELARVQEIVDRPVLQDLGRAFDSYTNSLLVHEPKLSS